MNTPIERKYITASLVSVTISLTVTMIHHVYRFGPSFILPFLILTLLPALLMYVFMKTQSASTPEQKSTWNRVSRWVYIIVVIAVVLAFGVEDGGLDHVFKLVGIPHISYLEGSELMVVKTFYNLISPDVSYWIYEGTGFSQTIIDIFVVYYLYTFTKYVK